MNLRFFNMEMMGSYDNLSSDNLYSDFSSGSDINLVSCSSRLFMCLVLLLPQRVSSYVVI